VPKGTTERKPAGALARAGPGPADDLVPAGFRLRADPRSRMLADGTLLTGGYPTRVLRLSRSGARHVAGWWSGAPVQDNPKARALARRLLDTGIAHPAVDEAAPAGPEHGADEVTVVVPVRDRHAELASCLAGLARESRLIVVDDGSRDPEAVASVAAGAGASVLRRPVTGGPTACPDQAGWICCCRTSRTRR